MPHTLPHALKPRSPHSYSSRPPSDMPTSPRREGIYMPGPTTAPAASSRCSSRVSRPPQFSCVRSPSYGCCCCASRRRCRTLNSLQGMGGRVYEFTPSRDNLFWLVAVDTNTKSSRRRQDHHGSSRHRPVYFTVHDDCDNESADRQSGWPRTLIRRESAVAEP